MPWVRRQARPGSPKVATTESTGDFNAHGALSGNALIGAKVYNAAKETVGTVQDVYLDAKGAVESVVVSVGGFLGVGTKNVAVKRYCR